MKKIKIAYISGTRADYGLMLPVLHAIQKSPTCRLQLYYTGMHLMKKFGHTQEAIKRDFPEAKPITALIESDNVAAVTQFIGTLIKKLTAELTADRPDFVLTLGDRPEMLAVATTCLYLGIPTGHIHGGDKTATIDEVARHAITKLSYLHFPATKEAALRIKKMGEEPWRIHITGAPALDFIKQEKLLTRKELCAFLRLDSAKPFILALQHPVSEEIAQSGFQMSQTIEAVKSFKIPTVIMYPNADPGSLAMIQTIEKEKNNPLFHIYKNLEYKTFLTLEKEAAVWIGNSSAAMIESSSFHTPVINIGTRQSGRQHGANVIHTGYHKDEIIRAIKKSLYDKTYLKRLQKMKNPWGDGNAGKRIIEVINNTKRDKKLLCKKITY